MRQVTADSQAVTPAAEIQFRDRELFGHPKGLMVLVGTEFWDRVSFHGMQALLVLYMVERLLLPGHVEHVLGFAGFRGAIESVTGPLSPQALAFQIFGLYLGMIYLTPLLGGVLGDRVLGRHRTVALGALLMTAGHFCMAFDRSFLVALLLLTVGAGCLRGNLMSQVGSLYSAKDRRRADAFQIYAASINAGAFLAPIICGALGKAYGWHYGFGFAGFGMLTGLVVYLLGTRHLPPDTPRTARVRVTLTPPERRIVRVLAMLTPVLALFWVAQSQVWNVYNIWVRDYVDLEIAGWTMPVPWVQSIDGLAPLATMPIVLAIWRWQARRSREPDEFAKLVIGCLLFGIATAWLAAGHWAFDGGVRIPLAWALVFHLVSNFGWLYFVPTVNALFVRAAPASVSAVMLGVYYLSIFGGSLASGRLGVFYERLDPPQFWMLHAAIVVAGGCVILLCSGALRRELGGGRGVPAAPAVREGDVV
jgi:proton-dependent oligopeptide transporter, POT family